MAGAAYQTSLSIGVGRRGANILAPLQNLRGDWSDIHMCFYRSRFPLVHFRTIAFLRFVELALQALPFLLLRGLQGLSLLR